MISKWVGGEPPIIQSSVASFLEVSVEGITCGGTFTIIGEYQGATVNETLVFDQESVKVTENQFESLISLLPSWSTFSVSIAAVNIQGEPVLNSATYGPFLCSVTASNSFTLDAELGRPGMQNNRVWRIVIWDFEPMDGDFVTTGKGLKGVLRNVERDFLLNYPVGWTCFLDENPN